MARRSERCSNLPRIFGCNASTKRPTNKEIELLSPPSDMGRGVHKALQIVVDKDLNHPPDLTQIISHFDIEDVDDLVRLTWTGINAWKNLKTWIEVICTEQKMESLIGTKWKLTGSGDIIGEDADGGLIILDWKSGYIFKDVKHQLYGYAKLALDKYKHFNHGKVISIWLRHNVIDILDFDREYIDGDWTEEFESNMSGRRYTPHPDFCAYCPHALNCDAKKMMNRSASVELVKAHEDQKVTDILGNFYDRSRMLKTAIKNYDDTLKQKITDSGGEFTFPDGRIASFNEEEHKEINFSLAWPILSRYFDCEEMAPKLIEQIGTSMKFKKKELFNFIKALAPKGQKGKAITAIMEELDGAGAISIKIVKKVRISKPLIEEGEISE